MTLFTREDCLLCARLKNSFDFDAMGVAVEVLDNDNAGALAHLAWHGLVEAARKSLPLLVLDDSTAVADFHHIEQHLRDRAGRSGVDHQKTGGETVVCVSGACAL
ncbi:MAG: hypothetical protein OEV91_11715 [Desulfobulbaceae bacterium]|nr:hypothetical protein [Desulfobulbaceae bacterium]